MGCLAATLLVLCLFVLFLVNLPNFPYVVVSAIQALVVCREMKVLLEAIMVVADVRLRCIHFTVVLCRVLF